MHDSVNAPPAVTLAPHSSTYPPSSGHFYGHLFPPQVPKWYFYIPCSQGMKLAVRLPPLPSHPLSCSCRRLRTFKYIYIYTYFRFQVGNGIHALSEGKPLPPSRHRKQLETPPRRHVSSKSVGGVPAAVTAVAEAAVASGGGGGGADGVSSRDCGKSTGGDGGRRGDGNGRGSSAAKISTPVKRPVSTLFFVFSVSTLFFIVRALFVF